VRFQIGVFAQILDVVLDQDQPWPVSGDRKAPQHRELGPLDVDREEVHALEADFGQHGIERPDRHGADLRRTHVLHDRSF
jgi:hypothetical protein